MMAAACRCLCRVQRLGDQTYGQACIVVRRSIGRRRDGSAAALVERPAATAAAACIDQSVQRDSLGRCQIKTSPP